MAGQSKLEWSDDEEWAPSEASEDEWQPSQSGPSAKKGGQKRQKAPTSPKKLAKKARKTQDRKAGRKLTHAERKQLKHKTCKTHPQEAHKHPAHLFNDHVKQFQASIDASQFADDLEAARTKYAADNDGAELLREMNGHAASEFRLSRELLKQFPSLKHVIDAVEKKGTIRDARIHLYGAGEGAPKHTDDFPAQVTVRVFVSITTDASDKQHGAKNTWSVHEVNTDGSTGKLLETFDVPMVNGAGVVQDRIGAGCETTGAEVIAHEVNPMPAGTCRGTAVLNVVLDADETIGSLADALAVAQPHTVSDQKASTTLLTRPACPKGCWSAKMKEYSNAIVIHSLPDGTLRAVRQSVLNWEIASGAEGYTCRACGLHLESTNEVYNVAAAKTLHQLCEDGTPGSMFSVANSKKVNIWHSDEHGNPVPAGTEGAIKHETGGASVKGGTLYTAEQRAAKGLPNDAKSTSELKSDGGKERVAKHKRGECGPNLVLDDPSAAGVESGRVRREKFAAQGVHYSDVNGGMGLPTDPKVKAGLRALGLPV